MNPQLLLGASAPQTHANPKPEKSFVRIGVMPLADAAPVVVAQAKGFFEKFGVEVEISTERAWAAVRDKIAAGVLDAAQMLAPMPLAATLGLDSIHLPMVTGLTLNLNGNAIVVSNPLHAQMAEVRKPVTPASGHGALAWSQALNQVIQANQRLGQPKLRFAHVYPFSTHHYELRYWLAAGGVDPDRDLDLLVVPPPQAVAALEAGRIDGFCVGAPWGEVAETASVGRRIVSKYQIWNNGPEKVLGVTQAWAAENPQTHLAIIAALIEAGRWLDRPENRTEAAWILSDEHYLDVPLSCVVSALRRNSPEHEFGPGLVFSVGAAGFPWRSQVRWFMQQMQRWQHLPELLNDASIEAAIEATCRPDIYRQAAELTGTPCPAVDLKSEGTHSGPWQLPSGDSSIAMGPDQFLDRAVFSV